MKAVFGIVSLLIALVIVGKLAATQLNALRGDSTKGAPAAATVQQQSRQMQDKVKTDVIKALEQGTATRREEPSQ